MNLKEGYDFDNVVSMMRLRIAKSIILLGILILFPWDMVLDDIAKDFAWGDSLSGEMKHRISPFGSEVLIQRAIKNTKNFTWAREMQNRIVKDVEPWMNLSDDELWGLMFGPKVWRSHFVKPYGGCPECGMEMVKYNTKYPSYPALYAWLYDPWEKPFKLWCPNPNCNAEFPKNDFGKYYQSGIGPDGLFSPERADKTFLHNVGHPDDEVNYGVDDGGPHGWRDWRFIAYYFRVAVWQQQILGGIDKLSLAYVATGNIEYAHKATILLDRVADVYPEMNYLEQGNVYHIEPSSKGYVEYSINACKNVTTMAIAYGRILGAVENDKSLVTFLSLKAVKSGLINKKDTIDKIRQNIENNIFQNALGNLDKLESNQPLPELMKIYCKIVTNRPHNNKEIVDDISRILHKWTQCDGLTGYKGLQEYAVSGVDHIGRLLYFVDQLDLGLFEKLVQSTPSLRATFNFYIDLWCLNLSYPAEGDGGVLGMRSSLEGPLDILTKHYIKKSTNHSLFPVYCRLYEVLKNDRYAQFIYELNGRSVVGLPGDLFAKNPKRAQRHIEMVIEQKGHLKPINTHKSEYHLVLLQSGIGETGRALWLDYDAEGVHRHLDGMNFGLFAKGLDLIADLGYPPDMGYGTTITRDWYQLSLSHNTVIVDGITQKGGVAELTIFEKRPGFGLIQAEGENLYKQYNQYQRTLALVDISLTDGYVIDLFRVVGGGEHLKSFHTTFGKIEHSLDVNPSLKTLAKGHLKNLYISSKPGKRFEMVWRIFDKYNYLPKDRKVFVHYTELTDFDEVIIGEGELGPGRTPATIPYVLTKRKAKSESGDLASVFVAVIEPYEDKRIIKNITKLKMVMADNSQCQNDVVGLRIDLVDGTCDYFIAADCEQTKFINKSAKMGVSDEIFCKEEGLLIKPGIYFFRVKDEIPEIIFANGKGLWYRQHELSGT